MASVRYNLRNPAVKRILQVLHTNPASLSIPHASQEMREMEKDDSLDFVAQAFEENIFEWHFVIRGPPETDFEGGVYHGRIILPSEYPFKPPSFMMLTKNGRFETNTKICLSISDYHPEHWQPSWSMRTALTALVAFLPTPGNGALGSIDLSSDVRKKLAAESRNAVVEFGTEERKKLARELHQKLQARIHNVSSSPKPAPERKEAEGSGRESSQRGEVQRGCENRVRMRHAGSRSEWIWTSLTYVLGVLIFAIVAKKILIRTGLADFASTE